MDIILTSQVSQLRTSKFIIDEWRLKNTIVVYIYAKDVDINKIFIEANIDINQFDEFECLPTPKNTIHPSLHKLNQIDQIYKSLIQRHNPQNVYLFSWGRSYNIFIKYAKQNGAKCIYIEEGLGTYMGKESLNTDISFSLKRFYRSIGINFINTIIKQHPLFSKVVRIIAYPFLIIIKYLYDIILFIVNCYTCIDIQILLLKLTRRHSEFFNINPKFDIARITFPYAAKKIINADKFEYFDILKSKLYEYSYSITEEMRPSSSKILFISQNYANKKTALIYYSCIFSILANISKENNISIDIKIHPKENKKLISDILSNYHDSQLVLLEDSSCPAEKLLQKNSNYKILLGISSSTMLYIAKYYPSIHIESIGNFLIYLLNKQHFPAAQINKIKSTISVMESVIPINQYYPYKSNTLFNNIILGE